MKTGAHLQLLTVALACGLAIGCSGSGQSDSAEPSSEPTALAAASSSVPDAAEPATSASAPPMSEPTAPVTIAASSSIPDTAAPAVEEQFEVAGSERAIVEGDVVTWSVAGVSDDPADRRYLVEIPGGVDVEVYEAPAGLPATQVVSGIFALGDVGVDGYVSVSVTPEPGGEPFDLALVSGEQTTIAGEPAVRRQLGVISDAVTFVVSGRRVDVVGPKGSADLIEQVAASVTLDADLVSATVPDQMQFVGAFPQASLILEGQVPFGLYFMPATTRVSFLVGDDNVGFLTISVGRVTNADELIPWLDVRAARASVGGLSGWVSTIAGEDVSYVVWEADGRFFQFWARGLPVDELLEVAATVRPATADEWAALPRGQ